MSRKISLVIYTLLHLLIDGICAYTIVNNLYIKNYNSAIIIFFLYNILAFCTQPILGMIVDKFKKKEIIYESLCAISIIFVLIGSSIVGNWLVSTMLLGLGNSLFHIVGGKETSNRSHNKLLPLGIFVSLGALGLFIGTNIDNILVLQIFRSLSLICVAIMFLLPNKYKFKENTEIIIEKRSHKFILLIPLVLAVVLRGFVGEILIKDMLVSFTDSLILVICVCLGKILGGLFVDNFGVKKTAVVTMAVFTVVCCCFPHNKMALYIGVLCFNMSMPITLYRFTKIFPKYEGFAFGFLSAFLLPAYLLGTYFVNAIQQDIVNYILVIIMLGCLNTIFIRMSDIKWLKRLY